MTICSGNSQQKNSVFCIPHPEAAGVYIPTHFNACENALWAPIAQQNTESLLRIGLRTMNQEWMTLLPGYSAASIRNGLEWSLQDKLMWTNSGQQWSLGSMATISGFQFNGGQGTNNSPDPNQTLQLGTIQKSPPPHVQDDSAKAHQISLDCDLAERKLRS
jgi:hypothetical protein